MPAKAPKRRSVKSRKPTGPKYIHAAEIEKLYGAAREGHFIPLPGKQRTSTSE